MAKLKPPGEDFWIGLLAVFRRFTPRVLMLVAFYALTMWALRDGNVSTVGAGFLLILAYALGTIGETIFGYVAWRNRRRSEGIVQNAFLEYADHQLEEQSKNGTALAPSDEETFDDERPPTKRKV